MKNEFKRLRLAQLDRGLEGTKSMLPRPAVGWIASIRQALGLSLAEIGGRIRLPRQNVQAFERAEADDRITLGTLRRVADAMGCDLIYALVPKSGSFTQLAEQTAREDATKDVRRVIHTMALEGQKPENMTSLIEGETQRRLNRDKRK